MSQDSRDIVYAFLGLGFGVWAFFKGFTRLRRKRLIENIPTSTIRSAPMGLVEIIGRATPARLVTSPLRQSKCVLYKYTIERYEKRGKSSSWVTVAKGDSCSCSFEVEDNTGKVLVLPQGCELIVAKDYEFTSGLGRSIPANLVEFLENHNIRYKAFLCNYSMRFREWIIEQSDNVYVLGTAQQNKEKFDAHKANVYKRLQELKDKPEFMQQADTDKDGIINEEEWQQAVDRVERDLLAEEAQSIDNLANDLMLAASGKEVFIISDKSQKDLVRTLAWQAFGGIFGGAALALLLLAYLILRFSGKF